MKLVLSAVACIVASATLSSASEPRLHLRHVADYEYDEVEAYNNPANKHVNGRGFHGKGAARRKERSAARKAKNETKKADRATKKAARKAKKEAGSAGEKAKKAERRAAKKAKKVGRKGKKIGKKGKNCANACKSLTKNTGHAKVSINGCPCFMYEKEPLADFFEMYEEDEIEFIAEFLFDSYDEDSYDDEDGSDSEDYDEEDSEDYYSYN